LHQTGHRVAKLHELIRFAVLPSHNITFEASSAPF
jgi:hypothetical protein